MKSKLNCGISIPVVGLGTFTAPHDREATETAIHMALKVGYRHFDTGSIYESESVLGHVLNEEFHNKTVQREDVFVTSKLWCSDHHDPVSALKKTLQIMNMEYLDMYLIHWPVKLKPSACYLVPKEDDFEELDLATTWAGMEKCFDLGLCKGIGVSNFSTKKIKQLLEIASVPPAIDQVEMSPLWKQKKLRDVCEEHKIHVSAYQPLGAPLSAWGTTAIVENPIIQSIALKHNAKPAQVVLNWGISKGSSVIVKSFNEQRMKENLESINLKLDEEDIAKIDSLEEKKMVQAEFLTNAKTVFYKTPQEIWDGEC